MVKSGAQGGGPSAKGKEKAVEHESTRVGQCERITVLKGRPRQDEAIAILKKIASHLDRADNHQLFAPIMRKHGWTLPILAEMFPTNPNLLGLNYNGGQKICIRLRPHTAPDTFYDLESSLVGTMAHELTHNMRGPHDEQFFKLMDGLMKEYDALRAGGFSGEGFLSDGNRAGQGVSHNLPQHEARALALRKAEERARISKVMGPAGGQRLGGTLSTEELVRLKNRKPSEVAAEAAERRMREIKGCVHDDGEVEREARKAAEDSETITILDDEAEEVAGAAATASEILEAVDEVDEKPVIDGKAAAGEKPLFAPEEDDSDDSDCVIVEPPPGYIPPVRPQPVAGPSKPAVRPTPPVTSTSYRPAPSSSKRPASSPPPVERPTIRLRPSTLPRELFSWACPRCTFANTAEYGLACELCAHERPSSAWPELDAADPTSLQPDRVTVSVTSRGADGREVTRTSTRVIGRTPPQIASSPGEPPKRVHTHFDADGWFCPNCSLKMEHMCAGRCAAHADRCSFWTCRQCGTVKTTSEMGGDVASKSSAALH